MLGVGETRRCHHALVIQVPWQSSLEMGVWSGGRKLPGKVTFKGLAGRRRRNGRKMDPLVRILLLWIELEQQRSASGPESKPGALGFVLRTLGNHQGSQAKERQNGSDI